MGGVARRCLIGALVCLAGIAWSAPAVAGAAVTTGWLGPSGISESGQFSFEAQVAFDPHGDAGVIWNHELGSGFGTAQVTTRAANGSWQPPLELGACGKASCEPHIAADPRGDLLAVWDRYNGFAFVVDADYKPAGASWQPPIRLSEAKIPGAAQPQVAVDSQGDAMVIWYRGGSVVEADFMPAGGAWQAPEVISGAGALIEARPEVAFDPFGDAIAVWTQDGSLVSAFRPASSPWAAPVALSTTGAAQEGHVAFDASGDAVAVWRKFTGGIGSPMIVQAAYRPAGEEWGTVQTLTTTKEIEHHLYAEHPTVAVATNGAAVATWTSGEKVKASRMAPGGIWSTPSIVSAEEGVAREPRVAFDAQGNASAIWTWQKSFHADYEVETATLPAGGSWQEPHVLAEAGSSFAPGLAFDAQGDAIAIWSDGTTDPVVESDGFVAAPPTFSSVSIPSTGYAGQPIGFSVSPFDVWSIFDEANWSFGDGGSASGTSVTHVYANPGTYEVTVRGTDTLGNATSSSGKITIEEPPPPSPPAGAPSPAATPTPSLHLVGETIVHGDGVAFTVECDGASGQRCDGEAVLASTTPAKGSRVGAASSGRARGRASGRVVLGSISFALGAAERRSLRVPYDREVRKLLSRLGRLPVTLTIALSAGDAQIVVASQEDVIHTLDTEIVAGSIRKALLAQRGLRTRVSCPRTVIQAKGNDFRCYASGKYRAGGRLRSFRTPFRVTQVNDQGNVVYRS